MALEAGVRLGPYEIEFALGAGGMGEVYRARDTRLGRTVAVKVLPPHLADSEEARGRFEREAKAVSGLNHPHICSLFDVGEADGTHFLVMEHLEGETLATRLQSGPLPRAEALGLAIQIADALTAAHRGGVVHRDLKPGNIIVTRDGAKLLDFGLAKDTADAGPALSSVAMTRSTPLTSEGMIVGTFQYMAPEQLEGKPADTRSDIFAFGAVLYEMLTGRRAFQGETQASLITSIMSAQPSDVSTVQPTAPRALDRLIHRCLAKDRDERWQNAHDLRLELEWIASGQAAGAEEGTARPATPRRFVWLPWGIAVAASAVALFLAFRPGPVVRPEADPVRFRVDLSDTVDADEVSSTVQMNLSPDGRHLALALADPGTGKPTLWVRSLDQPALRRLEGTEGATYPFWSPDGQYLAFFVPGSMKRYVFPDGPVQEIVDVPTGRGASWGTDGTILLSADKYGPIHRVPAAGGDLVRITEDRSAESVSHRWPVWLPDGKHFLFIEDEGPGGSLFVGSVDGEAPRLLTANASNPTFLSSGFVMYASDRVIVLHEFDVSNLELRGTPRNVSPGAVAFNAARSFAAYGVSDAGVLAYQPDTTEKSPMVLFDREGKRVGTLGEPGYRGKPRFSPDGRKMLMIVHPGHTEEGDLWVHDIERNTDSRLTFSPEQGPGGIWSLDGRSVIFGYRGIYRTSSSGGGTDTTLLEASNSTSPTSLTPDGKYLAYHLDSLSTLQDLWVMPLDGSGEPYAFVQTPFNDNQGCFSPDGRWMAYSSDQSGRNEVYVRPFPEGDRGRWQISNAGGSNARWSSDGSRIYYVAPDWTLMSVAVRAAGDTLESRAPRALFRLPRSTLANDSLYDVAPDGETFVVGSVAAAGLDHLTVEVGWHPPAD